MNWLRLTPSSRANESTVSPAPTTVVAPEPLDDEPLDDELDDELLADEPPDLAFGAVDALDDDPSDDDPGTTSSWPA